MRKLFAGLFATLLALTGLGFIGTSQAGAGSYLSCPDTSTDQWWITSYAGLGYTAHCVASANHITIDKHYGSTKVGLQFETWMPSDLTWYTMPWGGAQGAILFCHTSPTSYGLVAGSPGWEHDWSPSGGSVNHAHGIAGYQYRTETNNPNACSTFGWYGGLQFIP